ncbi:cutinase, partial [Mycena rebaudengoi]
GVDYAADVAGFLAGGDPIGSRNIVNQVTNQLTNAAASCPNVSRVRFSSYNQGGQLVHNSVKLISASVATRIKAAVIFGDPDNGQAVQDISAANTKIICHVGDNIYDHGVLILAPHLTYGQDAGTAASFIASHV